MHPEEIGELGGLIDLPRPAEANVQLLQSDQIDVESTDHLGRTAKIDLAVAALTVVDIERSDPYGSISHVADYETPCATMSPVSTPTSDLGQPTQEELYCYGHPKTPTRLRCSRCERPICGRCAIPASVGQHCPECVAEARRSAPKVRATLQANAPAVAAIIAINVVVFAAQLISSNVTFRFASFPVLIALGEWWRLLTPMFLHSPDFVFHILMNMYVLYIYGPIVEQAYGTKRFIPIYLICGFTGAVASYNLSSCQAYGVGASGAIFGVAGVLLVYLYKRRNSTFTQAAYKNILLFIGLNLMIGFVFAGIDNWAHIGGVAGGIALGVGLDDPARRIPMARQVAVMLVVVGVAVAAAAYRTATFSC
jgi:membrane associated rhomboid family serine protease